MTDLSKIRKKARKKFEEDEEMQEFIKGLVADIFKDEPPEIPLKTIEIRKEARERGIIADELPGLKDEDGNPFTQESTYYNCYNFTSRHGCGYVKGSPRRERYNDIGFLRGSTGFKFYCRVCGQKTGSYTTSIS